MMGRRPGAAALLLTLLVVAAPLLPAVPAAWAEEQHQGLQAGWAVDDRGNVHFTSSFSYHNPVMHEAEAGSVRLNFRLGACFSDWTSVGCNGRTALDTYDEIVDVALTNNIRVLGLISHESWRGSQEEWTANNAEHAGGNGDNAYVRHFGDDAAEVLATHFKDRIRHWEIWNEPNTWTERDEQGRPKGGSFTFPSNFAWALTRAHAAIKAARPDAVVITGGLFGHEIEGTALLFARDPCPTAVGSGGDYLCATYEMGLTHAGWQPGAYPFDHVGQHIYVDIGGVTTEEKLRFYLDDLRDAYLSYEGAETPKTTYVTEFGWSTTQVSPRIQAENLLIAFDTFRQVEYVARAYWFHAQDVPEAELHYGLTEGSGRQKPAFTVYQDVAVYDAPTDEADDTELAPGPGERRPGAGRGAAPRVPPQVPPVFRPGPDAAQPRATDVAYPRTPDAAQPRTTDGGRP